VCTSAALVPALASIAPAKPPKGARTSASFLTCGPRRPMLRVGAPAQHWVCRRKRVSYPMLPIVAQCCALFPRATLGPRSMPSASSGPARRLPVPTRPLHQYNDATPRKYALKIRKPATEVDPWPARRRIQDLRRRPRPGSPALDSHPSNSTTTGPPGKLRTKLQKSRRILPATGASALMAKKSPAPPWPARRRAGLHALPLLTPDRKGRARARRKWIGGTHRTANRLREDRVWPPLLVASFCAPKERTIPAQGEALGQRETPFSALKGRTIPRGPCPVSTPFQG